MPGVIVYTAEHCPYCEQAKRLLKERAIAFEEIRLDENDDRAWDELTARTGMKTVPQILASGRLIGGFTELSALDQKDRLASLKLD